MSDWFTVEAIAPGTYAISEYRHWEETHCYLLLGSRRAVLIDTGLGVADIRQVTDALTGLPLQVLTTHAHWDHIGGHGLFDSIAVHPAEADWLSGVFPLPLGAVKANLLRAPCAFPPDFDPARYRLYHGVPSQLLHDGDELDLGGRRLTVLHTPGHSPGHCCFYEADRGDLYTGDLIYQGCLDAFYPTTDPVQFFHSVRLVAPLAVNRILPGHYSLSLSPHLISQVEEAFSGLDRAGQLVQGAGVFDFGEFQIHL